jgi:hypothetical protein
MILEALVTTTNPDGTPHVAPMGPDVAPDFSRFQLRPFPSSKTYRNLVAHPEGVIHVTDDALLLAKASVGAADPRARVRLADKVKGFVLVGACRYFEFKVSRTDTSEPRVRIDADIVNVGTLRDFWGFNRGKNAILEAAILATRLHLLPLDDVAAEFKRLRMIVDKTGGPDEFEAMTFLDEYLDKFRAGTATEGTSA